MERIFKKNFVYAVDSYEVWSNQKCIQQKEVDGEIIGIVYGEYMYFVGMGFNEEDSFKPFKVCLNSPSTQILEVDNASIINESRIQYYNDEFSGSSEPYICHLFCKYGRISYIRFATATKESNSFFPMPDKIYEYYGDMIEIGQFSKESIMKIESVCKQIIATNASNLQISLAESVNSNMVWNSMSESFKAELHSVFNQIELFNSSWEIIVSIYTEDLIKKYHDTLGYISFFTFNKICEDVYDAANRIHKSTINDCSLLKFKVIFDLIA